MPGPGQSEPYELPYLAFKLDNVVALSPPPNPSTIIQAGQSVELRVDLGVEGYWAGLLVGENFSVFHHTEREEDGDRKTLPGRSDTVPTPPASAASFSVITGPFTTGQAGSGADLEIPAGYSAGTFEILTHIHFNDQWKEPIVAAFHSMYIMVT